MGFKLTTLVVIGIDGIGSCKSNQHTITTVPNVTKDSQNDGIKYWQDVVNKTDGQVITEILLKVALNTKTLTLTLNVQ
jgi:hypothetical protein